MLPNSFYFFCFLFVCYFPVSVFLLRSKILFSLLFFGLSLSISISPTNACLLVLSMEHCVDTSVGNKSGYLHSFIWFLISDFVLFFFSREQLQRASPYYVFFLKMRKKKSFKQRLRLACVRASARNIYITKKNYENRKKPRLDISSGCHGNASRKIRWRKTKTFQLLNDNKSKTTTNQPVVSTAM